jgi:hypothetical protein
MGPCSIPTDHTNISAEIVLRLQLGQSQRCHAAHRRGERSGEDVVLAQEVVAAKLSNSDVLLRQRFSKQFTKFEFTHSIFQAVSWFRE